MESPLTPLPFLRNFVPFGYSGNGLKDETYQLVGMMNNKGLRVVMDGLWKGGWKI